MCRCGCSAKKWMPGSRRPNDELAAPPRRYRPKWSVLVAARFCRIYLRRLDSSRATLSRDGKYYRLSTAVFASQTSWSTFPVRAARRGGRGSTDSILTATAATRRVPAQKISPRSRAARVPWLRPGPWQNPAQSAAVRARRPATCPTRRTARAVVRSYASQEAEATRCHCELTRARPLPSESRNGLLRRFHHERLRRPQIREQVAQFSVGPSGEQRLGHQRPAGALQRHHLLAGERDVHPRHVAQHHAL
jgi:hypothetical protein